MVEDDNRLRQMPEHGYTISSSCEPNSSGELIKSKGPVSFSQFKGMSVSAALHIFHNQGSKCENWT